jgi:hypothetical protein
LASRGRRGRGIVQTSTRQNERVFAMLNAEPSTKRDEMGPFMFTMPKGLAEIAKQLKAELRRGAYAEIRVSIEVMKLAASWEKYRDEAGGKEIGPWLTSYVHPTKRLQWYRDRAEAACSLVAKRHKLAERMDSGALVRLCKGVTGDAQLESAAKVVGAAYAKNNKMPVTVGQLSKICSQFITKGNSRQRQSEEIRALRARCVRLEEQVRGLGGEPVA